MLIKLLITLAIACVATTAGAQHLQPPAGSGVADSLLRNTDPLSLRYQLSKGDRPPVPWTQDRNGVTIMSSPFFAEPKREEEKPGVVRPNYPGTMPNIIPSTVPQDEEFVIVPRGSQGAR